MKIDKRLSKFIRRLYAGLAKRHFLPATLTLLLIVLSVGLVHGTWYDRLPYEVRMMFGHSPEHASDGNLHRIFTSLPLTGDPYHLGSALLMTLLCVGWLELQRGPWLAIFVFVATHVATVFVESQILAGVVAWQEHSPFRWMLTTNDVGPSAGYYGCLAASLMGLRKSSRTWLTIGLLIWLSVRLARSMAHSPVGVTDIQSDLAHMIAVLIGLSVSAMWLRRPVASNALMEPQRNADERR